MSLELEILLHISQLPPSVLHDLVYKNFQILIGSSLVFLEMSLIFEEKKQEGLEYIEGLEAEVKSIKPSESRVKLFFNQM